MQNHLKNLSEVVMITKMKCSKAKYAPKPACKRNIPYRKKVLLTFVREIIKFSMQGSTGMGVGVGGSGGTTPIFPQICAELISQDRGPAGKH